jgi:HEAT repeat protein
MVRTRDKGRANAAEALGNLALRNKDIAAAVVQAGAIPLLVELLSDDSDEGSADAVEALGKLASGNVNIAAVIVRAGAIPLLVDLLRGRGSGKGRKFAVMALYHLTSHNAGRRQLKRLGYTRDRLRQLQARRSIEH